MNPVTPNILVDALPLTVNVGGRDFPITTDFRAGILLEMLLNDRKATKEDRAAFALDLYYPDGWPDDYDEALRQITWFYSCGKPPKALPARIRTQQNQRRIYDFDIDAERIYAAFWQAYGIDLADADMHWWKFRALFVGLPADTEIVKIMGYRSIDVSKIKDKDQQAHYRKLQATYSLANALDDEEKIAHIGALFAGGIA